jgi:predicted acylesterase/phospholipase RssA
MKGENVDELMKGENVDELMKGENVDELMKGENVDELMKVDKLVLSGGGVKGIAYIGVFRRLRELSIDIREICAVSVGSIMGLLYLLGYSDKELRDEIKGQDFDSLKDINIGNFLSRYGIDTGKNVVRWIGGLLEGKGYSRDTTFLGLYKRTGVKYRILVTNLNRYEQVIFDYMTSPDMKITRAIRMSISIPFVFTMQRYNVDIYVDGQLASSCVLKRFPDISSDDVKITPDDGFSGMISRVKFTNSAMTIQQAKQIYYDGPVAKDTLFSIIPEWIYWTILIIIIVSLVYSMLMKIINLFLI